VPAAPAGFAMNLVNSVFALVPVRPNEGVEIFAWNKALRALLFFPMIAVYLYIYRQFFFLK
jgi:Zn-dependent protease